MCWIFLNKKLSNKTLKLTTHIILSFTFSFCHTQTQASCLVKVLPPQRKTSLHLSAVCGMTFQTVPHLSNNTLVCVNTRVKPFMQDRIKIEKIIRFVKQTQIVCPCTLKHIDERTFCETCPQSTFKCLPRI